MFRTEKNREYQRLLDVIEQLSEEKSKVGLVLDSSLADVMFFRDDIDKILEKNYKVILLDMTVEELQSMKSAKLDLCGRNAKYLLKQAAIKADNFTIIPTNNQFIPEPKSKFLSGTDQEVIEYCRNHKKNVVLVTCKTRQAIDARSFGIRTFFLQKNMGDVTVTLYGTKKTAQGLLFWIDSSESGKYVRVISKGLTYTDGEVFLNIGDHVLIAKKHHEGISFKHLRIVELQEKANAENVFSTFIENGKDLSTYPLFYRDFLREVMETSK